jgi:Ca2+-binding EF-hand superfamily protein
MDPYEVNTAGYEIQSYRKNFTVSTLESAMGCRTNITQDVTQLIESTVSFARNIAVFHGLCVPPVLSRTVTIGATFDCMNVSYSQVVVNGCKRMADDAIDDVKTELSTLFRTPQDPLQAQACNTDQDAVLSEAEVLACYGTDGRRHANDTTARTFFVIAEGGNRVTLDQFRTVYGNISDDELAIIDSDGDGNITQAEYAATFGQDDRPHSDDPVESLFAVLVTSGETTITLAKLEQMYPDIFNSSSGLIDADGDGRVNITEFQNTMSKEFEDGDVVSKEFAAVSNHTGEISMDDFNAAYGNTYNTEFLRIDTNGDGKVTETEFLAAYGDTARKLAKVDDPVTHEFLLLSPSGDAVAKEDFLQAYGLVEPSDEFHRVDTNGDGEVTQAEFRAAYDRTDRSVASVPLTTFPPMVSVSLGSGAIPFMGACSHTGVRNVCIETPTIPGCAAQGCDAAKLQEYLKRSIAWQGPDATFAPTTAPPIVPIVRENLADVSSGYIITGSPDFTNINNFEPPNGQIDQDEFTNWVLVDSTATLTHQAEFDLLLRASDTSTSNTSVGLVELPYLNLTTLTTNQVQTLNTVSLNYTDYVRFLQDGYSLQESETVGSTVRRLLQSSSALLLRAPELAADRWWAIMRSLETNVSVTMGVTPTTWNVVNDVLIETNSFVSSGSGDEPVPFAAVDVYTPTDAMRVTHITFSGEFNFTTSAASAAARRSASGNNAIVSVIEPLVADVIVSLLDLPNTTVVQTNTSVVSQEDDTKLITVLFKVDLPSDTGLVTVGRFQRLVANADVSSINMLFFSNEFQLTTIRTDTPSIHLVSTVQPDEISEMDWWVHAIAVGVLVSLVAVAGYFSITHEPKTPLPSTAEGEGLLSQTTDPQNASNGSVTIPKKLRKSTFF